MIEIPNLFLVNFHSVGKEKRSRSLFTDTRIEELEITDRFTGSERDLTLMGHLSAKKC
jgi:hypothetical protein